MLKALCQAPDNRLRQLYLLIELILNCALRFPPVGRARPPRGREASVEHQRNPPSELDGFRFAQPILLPAARLVCRTAARKWARASG